MLRKIEFIKFMIMLLFGMFSQIIVLAAHNELNGIQLNVSEPDTLIDLNEGLVLYYPFNNNANDESGNDNNGTVNSNTITFDRFGNSKSAYKFNSTNYITNTTLFQEKANVFSVCFWMKIKEFGDDLWANHISAANRWGAFTFHTMNDGSAYCGIEDWDNARFSSITDIPASTFKTGSWQFVVFTFDQGKARFYVDNKLIAKSDNMKSPRKSWDGIHIGRGSAITNVNGVVDDIRVYEKALNTSTIQRLYEENVSINIQSTPLYENKHVIPENASPTNFNIVQKDDGNLYMRNFSRLLKYNGIEWSIINSNLTNRVEALGKGADDKIYLSTINQVGYLSYEDEIEHFNIIAKSNDTLNIDFVSEIVNVKNQTYFVNVHGILKLESNKLSYYQPDNNSLLDHAFSYDQRLYLNLQDQGLSYFDGQEFKDVSNGFLTKNELIAGTVSHSEGLLLICKSGNTFLLKNNSLQLRHFLIDQLKNEIASSGISCVTTYNDGILIGTEKKGIYYVKNGTSLGVINQSNGLSSNKIFDIYVLGSYIWVSTDNGINTINNLERWQHWPLHYDREGIITGITKHLDQIYVQTTKALYKVEKNKLVFAELEGSIDFPQPVNDSLLTEDSLGNKWHIITPVSKSDILRSFKNLENGYNEIVTDKYSTLKDPFIVNIYPDSDKKGIIWIAGSQGLYRLDDRESRGIETIINKVSSSDSILFDYNSEEVFPNSPSFKREIGTMSFQFASINGNEYSYRLLGSGNNWSDWTHKDEKEYANLPAGEYTFEVKARDVLNEQGTATKYQFSILHKWYESKWVIFTASLTLLVLIFGIIAINRRGFKNQISIVEKSNKSKDTVLKILTHDLRSPLVTMQARLKQEQYRNDTRSMSKSVDETIQVADQVLELVVKGKDSLTVKRQVIELDELIEEVIDQNNSTILDRHLSVSVKNNLEDAIISDEKILLFILRNTLGNALKHAQSNSEIEVQCFNQNNYHVIQISNLIGSDSSYNGAGVGLKLVQELIEWVNADIEQESDGYQYTTRILLPSKMTKQEY